MQEIQGSLARHQMRDEFVGPQQRRTKHTAKTPERQPPSVAKGHPDNAARHDEHHDESNPHCPKNGEQTDAPIASQCHPRPERHHKQRRVFFD